jgi:hypothetical protein
MGGEQGAKLFADGLRQQGRQARGQVAEVGERIRIVPHAGGD